MSENLSPFTAETSTNEDDTDRSKSKSKKKAIGAFVVEVEPPNEAAARADRRKERATDAAVADKKLKIVESEPEAESKSLAVESLEPEEISYVTKQLAAARLAEIAEQSPVTAEEQAEHDAVAAYLVAVEASGNIASNADTSAPAEQTIDTYVPNEGEINLHDASQHKAIETTKTSEEQAEPTASEPVTSAPAGGGSGGRPPRNPGASGETAPDPNEPPRSTPTAEQVISVDEAGRNERQAEADGLLVGAIIGYLFGRRRGRIKTEKRLAPVQRKLEKQVKNLQAELLTNETLVRRSVRQQSVERLTQPRAQKVEADGTTVPPERIGHVLVAASAERVVRRPELTAKKVSKTEILTAKKQAETMSRNELLALSEKVLVDGTNLRQIYETQLVSERGLRRLVAEHLRGGNVSRALRRELIERQIDFERDPILRDKAHGEAVVSSGKAVFSKLLAQAGVSADADTGSSFQVISKQPTKTQDGSAQAKKRQQVVIDSALVTLITVLTLLIILVLLRNR
ncbi:MAG: hypothetical protein QFB87_01700 [Patescibacteria group bacterium]|nr:hypothetical protein [Patescibacteria group bacterium]